MERDNLHMRLTEDSCRRQRGWLERHRAIVGGDKSGKRLLQKTRRLESAAFAKSF